MPDTWRNTVGRSGAPIAPPDESFGPTFLEHYASRHFHQRILCQRTGSTVTFAQGGDLLSPDVVLYCLPSGCSRYLILFLDGICRKTRVRIVGIDRPGAGGTSICALKDRIAVSTLQTVSVLRHLDLIDDQLNHKGSPVTILSHSAGIFYALALISHFEEIRSQHESRVRFLSPFGAQPKLLVCSPWVPVSISRSTLALLPPSLIRLYSSQIVHKLAGTIQGSLGVLTSTGKGLFDWSSGGTRASGRAAAGVHGGGGGGGDDDEFHAGASAHQSFENPFLNASGTEPPPSPQSHRGQKIRASARERHPEAHFLPPYDHCYKYSTSLRAFPTSTALSHPATGRPFRLTTEAGVQLLCDFMNAEGTKGVTEDFLLCLGHAPGFPNNELERLVRRGVDAVAGIPAGANITCVWADGDRLVSPRGRQWFDGLFYEAVRSTRGRVSYERLKMAEAGHDLPMVSEAVIVDLLRRIKGRKSATGERHTSGGRSDIGRNAESLNHGSPTPSLLETPPMGGHPFATSSARTSPKPLSHRTALPQT